MRPIRPAQGRPERRRGTVTDRDVRQVQVAYPKIYLACHTRHVRRRSSATGLSATDSSLLAHLDEQRPTRPTALARHLGVAASTLSAAIARLTAHGYVHQQRDTNDRRAIGMVLSPKGVVAMQNSSVLETARVRRMLARLGAAERKRALAGLALLANAAAESRS